MQGRAIAANLEPGQTLAAAEPDSEVSMLTYVCAGCNNRFADTGTYFYGIASTRCIWCRKFPKGKTK